jgi:hypothetical protein
MQFNLPGKSYARAFCSEGLGKSNGASSRRSARMRCSNVDDHAVRGVNVGRFHSWPRVAMMDEAEYSPPWLALLCSTMPLPTQGEMSIVGTRTPSRSKGKVMLTPSSAASL